MAPLSENDAIQARLQAGAYRKATDQVVRHSELRGEQAEIVARCAVAAAAPGLRAEHVQRLAKVGVAEAATTGILLCATLAADAAVYVATFRRGGRTARLVAGTALALHFGMSGYLQYRKQRVRAAARTELGLAAGRKGGTR